MWVKVCPHIKLTNNGNQQNMKGRLIANKPNHLLPTLESFYF